TSGEAEDKVIGEFVALLGAADVPYVRAAHLPLPELGAILQRCSLYLGHDSGISHLAAACGIPCVLLFGPTEPAIWAPRNPQVITLKAPEDELSKADPAVVSEAARELLSASG
ncbi:MAG: glycosyltransferase family 9 protein, partial [Verrucomicrobiales bacterium]